MPTTRTQLLTASKTLLATLATHLGERFVVYLFLVGVFLYLSVYALFVSGGLVWTAPSAWMLLILLPILLIDCIKMAVESFATRTSYTGGEETEKITVIVACRNGGESLGFTLMDLLHRFTPEQIIVASNGSTDATCTITRDYGVRLLDIRESVGKVTAINRALDLVTTPYTLVLDDDVLIGDAVLPTKLLATRYSGIAFRIYPIVKNAVGQMQSYEYRKSMDIGRSYHSTRACVQNISGAIGLFKTSELRRQVSVHTGEFSGEDLQRTLLIHLSSKSKGVVMTDSVVHTEVPGSLWAIFNQRVYGWNPGFYVNISNYFRILTSKRAPLRLRYEAFHNLFFVMLLDPLRLITLPALVFYPYTIIIFYATYLLIELVPYLKLKERAPFWVILVTPFYGLFGFITRLCAFVVFLYRRIVVLMSRFEKFDDYRVAASKERAFSIFATQTLVMVVLALSLNLNINGTLARESVETTQIYENVEATTAVVTESNISFAPTHFTHTVKAGESPESIAFLYYQDESKWIHIKTADGSFSLTPGEVVEIKIPTTGTE